MNDYELVKVAWKFQDTPNTIGTGIIAIGHVPQELKDEPSFDDNIFYYCDTIEEYEELHKPDNTLSDFYIVTEEN